jgi:hypothetical protein
LILEIEHEQTEATKWDLFFCFFWLLLSERQLEKGRTRMEQVRLRGMIQFSAAWR